LSNRQIGELLGISHPTVGRILQHHHVGGSRDARRTTASRKW
jgi:hypothetical protein